MSTFASGADSWAADTDHTRAERARMVAALVEAGDITEQRWQEAFAAVPRHGLVPRYYRADNYQQVTAQVPDDHATWLQAVYSDQTLITQKTEHTVTSSGTMPSLIALMLHALDVQDGHRILQIGTGTGYTSALLCERLGSGQVTTIDIDPDLVQAARDRLASLGYQPAAVTGDGASGHPATCALPPLPRHLRTAGHPLGMARPSRPRGAHRRTHREGTHRARRPRHRPRRGTVLPEGGYYMPLRHSTQRHGTGEPRHRDAPASTVPPRQARPTALGPRDTFYHQHVRFFLTLALPEVTVAQHGPSIDDLIIRDDTGSSARLDPTSEGTVQVTEAGPRALWTEVEHLHRRWLALDEPQRPRFGLTATPERQWIWLDSPHGDIGRLPALSS